MTRRAGSPADRARIRAREIDPSDVEDAANHAAEEAAYGCSLPRDPEEYSHRLMRLETARTPRNGGAWTAAKRAAYLNLTYPESAIISWFADAGVANPAEAAADIARDLAEACEAFREERSAEGLHWKRGKTAGLGNHELRKHLAATGGAAIELGLAFQGLQREATRPGHAHTSRGARVRSLYRQVVDNLIQEIAKAGKFDEADAPTLAKLHSHIEVDGDGYSGGAAVIELALVRHGRWCQSAARNQRWWAELPMARSTPSPARNRFIERLAQCWQRATSTPATCTDADDTSRTSGFVTFVACIYGHFAGLAEARFVDQDKAAEFLAALGIPKVPTARTINDILKRAEIRSAGLEE